VSFYGSGLAIGFEGLVVGSTYFLSATEPGKVTREMPTGSGHLCQIVGIALSATEIQVDVDERPVIRA